MSAEHKEFSRIFAEIRRELKHFASGYAIAVKSGADVVGQEIMKTVGKSGQPDDVPVGKLIAAVKSGVSHASEQMINSGAEFVEQMKKRTKNKKKT